jgi:hypothetical protein
MKSALVAWQATPRVRFRAGRCIRGWLALMCLAALSCPDVTTAAPAADKATTAVRDGQRDFDFEFGSWEIHLKKRLHPLTGSNEWLRFDGTSVTRKVWNGRAQIEEFETDGAGGRLEGLTLRLYNPQTHQWSLYWANSKDGLLVAPQVGQFKDGVGEFYGWDTFNGKPILIRFIWSRTTSSAPHFEQSFSEDGGKTWEVNWITDQTRVDGAAIREPPAPGAGAAAAAPGRDGQHDFDPLIGSWNYRLKRRLHPLTGSTTWVEFGGTGVCVTLWNGRANLDQAEFDGPSGHIEGLTLRLYDPQAQQWRLYWANSASPTVELPQVGEFRDGHGEFYALDTINGKTILVRYDWSKLTGTPHFEQAFSTDGGKTWEVNWITDQARRPADPRSASE